MGRCCRLIFGSSEDNLKMGNPTTEVVYPIVGEHEDGKKKPKNFRRKYRINMLRLKSICNRVKSIIT